MRKQVRGTGRREREKNRGFSEREEGKRCVRVFARAFVSARVYVYVRAGVPASQDF